MSSCTRARNAAPSVVIAAITLTTVSTNGSACTKTSNIRPTR